MYIWAWFLEKFVYSVVKIKKCKNASKNNNKNYELFSELVGWSFNLFSTTLSAVPPPCYCFCLSNLVLCCSPNLFLKTTTKQHLYQLYKYIISKRILKSKKYCGHQRTIYVRSAISHLIHKI